MHSINPTDFFAKGRLGDPRLGESVKTIRLGDSPQTKNSLILYGCPDDTGVLANRGRAGAKGGPDSIRKHLYKMTLPMQFSKSKSFSLYDAGNIEIADSITQTHENAYQTAKTIAQTKSTLLALGGGHDFAAPNFLGFIDGKKSKKIGLINVDPHLDVRELENSLPHSGTPFRQILDSGKISPKNFVEFGIRQNRNARPHYEWCKKQKVQILTWEEIRLKQAAAHKQFSLVLSKLSKVNELVGVTVDIDSCESAEGASAAPVLGFTATELYFIAKAAGLNKKVQYFEICEVAPVLDSTERSSRIAAEILFAFMEARTTLNR